MFPIMAYIARVEKGRYTYLYECRSHRVPGKDNPVSDRIFIGRVDRETREFIPKRYHVTETIDMESLEVIGGIKDLPRVPACYLPMRDKVTS